MLPQRRLANFSLSVLKKLLMYFFTKKYGNNCSSPYFFPARLISQKIMAIITMTPITPTHTPALNIPAIAWQLVSVRAMKNIGIRIRLTLNWFISVFLF
jgi:hypothetical protein